MIYTLSVDLFNSTFAVKENGTKLTHFSGKRFKLFPFIANNNSNPVRELNVLIGRYLSQIVQKEPVPVTAEELINKLKEKGAHICHNGKSIYYNSISPSCIDCHTGYGSATYIITLKIYSHHIYRYILF